MDARDDSDLDHPAGDDSGRAEDAVRAAFQRHYQSQPVKETRSRAESQVTLSAPPTRRRLVVLALAAALLLVVVGTGVRVLNRTSGPAAPVETVSGVPTSQQVTPSGTSPGTPTPATSKPRSWPTLRPIPATPLPPAPTGKRWVTYRDAAILVPTSWTLETSLAASVTCSGTWGSNRPLVLIPFPGVVDLPCLPEPSHPTSITPAPFAAFVDGPEGVAEVGTRTIIAVGSTWLAVVTFDPKQTAEAQAILDSARVTEADAHGCPAEKTGAGYQKFPIPDEIDGITACEYLGGQEPSLFSGERLDDAAAQRVWAAYRSAPEQQGLVVIKEGCSPVPPPVVLHLYIQAKAGVFQDVVLEVNFDACSGTGVASGRVTRQLTADFCRTLFFSDTQPRQLRNPVVTPALAQQPDAGCSPK